MNVVVLVVAIVLTVALVQAAIWIPLARRWRRAGEAFWNDFDRQCQTSGEVVEVRESGIYRGGTGPYSNVKGNGTIALTDRRLVFRKATGGVVEVPRSRIDGVSLAKVFQGSVVGNHVHLVVHTDEPAEVAFFVGDAEGWAARLGPAAAS